MVSGDVPIDDSWKWKEGDESQQALDTCLLTPVLAHARWVQPIGECSHQRKGLLLAPGLDSLLSWHLPTQFLVVTAESWIL